MRLAVVRVLGPGQERRGARAGPPVAVAVLALAACSTLPEDPRVAALVADVSEANLRRTVADLERIGPRPVGDVEATERCLDYLRRTLEGFGYACFQDQHAFPLASRTVARVRRPGSSAVEEIETPGVPVAGRAPSGLAELAQELRDDGWIVEGFAARPAPELGPVPAPNLFVELRGRDLPDRIVELGAHYDTVARSPGADDSSSGVAALLEVARLLADRPGRRTIRFCFFGSEENGLLGSAHHVERLLEDPREVEGLLNLDGVGYASDAPDSQRTPFRFPLIVWPPRTGDFIAVIGNWSSGALGNLFEAAADRYVPALPYYSANRIGGWFRDAARSDHARYWDAGLVGVLVTDTGEFRNPAYHRSTDTAETLDYEFLRQVAQAVLATAIVWAERDRL